MSGKSAISGRSRQVSREMLRELHGDAPGKKSFAVSAAVAGTGRKSAKAKRSKKRS